MAHPRCSKGFDVVKEDMVSVLFCKKVKSHYTIFTTSSVHCNMLMCLLCTQTCSNDIVLTCYPASIQW